MYQQNKRFGYIFGPALPPGSALDWDMTSLTNEQLEHEYHLAYESLYGHTYEGKIMIKGIRDPEYVPPQNIDKETIENAHRVWNLRFSRAEAELERRYLLS